jgi:gluconokinase
MGRPGAPVTIVVMGVSGCGKSTVGRALASALGVPFIEGDELHPPRNVALMASGTPLADEDRLDWLQAVAAALAAAAGSGAVAACSALKRSYRDILRSGAPGLRFVHLTGEPELLEARLRRRSGHYMPASLLQSQLDILESPGPDENAVTLDVAASPAEVLAAVRQQLECTSA